MALEIPVGQSDRRKYEPGSDHSLQHNGNGEHSKNVLHLILRRKRIFRPVDNWLASYWIAPRIAANGAGVLKNSSNC